MLKVRAGRFVALVAALLCASGVALPAPGARAATLAASGSPIRLVVSVPAGSSADVAARLLADGMEKTLGRPVVVENRPGADGIIIGWQPLPPRYTRGVLAKYARLVQSASTGAVCD